MGRARIYFVKLNLDDFAATVAGLDSDLEYRQFVEGFLVGARGFESRDTWSEAKINGHTVGDGCFKEAQHFSALQRDRVNHRYPTPTQQLPRYYHGTTADLPEGYLTNNHQLTTNNQPKSSPSPSAQSVPSPSVRGTKAASKSKGKTPGEMLADHPKEVGIQFWKLAKAWAGNKQKVKAAITAYLEAIKTSDPDIIQQAAELESSKKGKFCTSLEVWLSEYGWMALTGGE